MKVRDVMSAPVFTVHCDTSFADVVDQLLACDVSGAPVVDDDGRLLGVVSEADLISNEAYGYRKRGALGFISAFLHDRDPQWFRKASGRTARELMTGAPATASPDESLGVVARRMLEQHHKRMPVVEDGNLVGIVTRHDLLKQFHRSDAELQAAVAALLTDELSVPPTHHVYASVQSGVVTLEGNVEWGDEIRLFEHVIARLPGVIAVDNHLTAAP